jgi:hypothetical protein
MRAPRYRFPDEVRATTRTIATRMIQEGPIARTAEDLDDWLAHEPDLEASLRRGGYGTEFTSRDLFPLLDVFIVQAGGAPPADDPGGGSSRRWWLAALGLALLAVMLALALGCAGPPAPLVPAGEPYVRGPVESVPHHATASNLLVRAGPGSREACGISARVDSRTRYLRRDSTGEVRAWAMADLDVGDTVEVYVEGPVAESCPVQGYAAVVVLAGTPAARR